MPAEISNVEQKISFWKEIEKKASLGLECVASYQEKSYSNTTNNIKKLKLRERTDCNKYVDNTKTYLWRDKASGKNDHK
jgi:hypothetical protein